MNALVTIPSTGVENYRQSTDAAGLCRDIVIKTAMEIQGRRYVKVEGWQALAIAHGCTGSARDVEQVEGGVRAIGEIRRMSDGALIAQAEGFVGEDEPTWFGGEVVTKYGKKTLPKRPDYAIRAMAQTRAISRACRSAFAHVVVLIDAGLSTTPAEEVPHGGFDNETGEVTEPRKSSAQAKRDGDWETMEAEMKALGSTAELDAWSKANWGRIQKLPAKWVEQLQERFFAYRDEIEASENRAAEGSEALVGEFAEVAA